MTHPEPAGPSSTLSWKRVLQRCGLVYLFSRVLVLLGAGVVAAELRHDVNVVVEKFPHVSLIDPDYAGKAISGSGLRLASDVLMSWDGLWYTRIVQLGYPRVVAPNVTYDMPDARAAFFPTYPLLVRMVDRVLPGEVAVASLFVNFVLGALAVWLTGLLARELFGQRVAQRTMVLMCLFPGAFVLSFAYTEALLITVAAACLLLLHRRHWLGAGVLAAIGTATRPNGIALVAACGVAALIAIRRDGQWRALSSVLLAPLGFIGFQIWLGHHTGEPGVWFRVQTEAWGEGASFGYTALRRSFNAVVSPFSSPTNTITVATVAAMIALLWFVWKVRLPWPMLAYCAGVLALMLLPATVTARPRFLYTAFPLFISAAAWFEQRLHARPSSQAWTYTIAASAAGLVWLVALFGVFGAIP